MTETFAEKVGRIVDEEYAKAEADKTQSLLQHMARVEIEKTLRGAADEWANQALADFLNREGWGPWRAFASVARRSISYPALTLAMH